MLQKKALPKPQGFLVHASTLIPIKVLTSLQTDDKFINVDQVEKQMTQLNAGLGQALDRLQVVASILIPVLYWLAVTAVLLTALAVKAVRYITPIVIDHVTAQMGRKIYPREYQAITIQDLWA